MDTVLYNNELQLGRFAEYLLNQRLVPEKNADLVAEERGALATNVCFGSDLLFLDFVRSITRRRGANPFFCSFLRVTPRLRVNQSFLHSELLKLETGVRTVAGERRGAGPRGTGGG